MYLSFSFFLNSQIERFFRNKKLIGCCVCTLVSSAEWALTCQAAWACSNRYLKVSKWQHNQTNPFLKTNGVCPKEKYHHPWCCGGQCFQYGRIFPILPLHRNQQHYIEHVVKFGIFRFLITFNFCKLCGPPF